MVVSMRTDDKSNGPAEKFEQHQKESLAAYESLHKEIETKSGKQARRFHSLYKVYEIFGGYRESHKYYLAFVTDLLRHRILEEGRGLHKAGRLQSVEQAFDLTLAELDMAISDTSVDLIEQAEENRRFIDRLARVPQLPSVIDSRGLVVRPPALPVGEGEVAGTPISPGVARGRIKVLHSADEKALLKGEVLVARATDPGWTPLFVNAAAVILEIGGVLQHGALVAREYGLPCVAGIENATELWKDGTLVEVDGFAGIVRTVIQEKQ
jgi:pyruvate,water dikinase